jgi:hypothetical protein
MRGWGFIACASGIAAGVHCGGSENSQDAHTGDAASEQDSAVRDAALADVSHSSTDGGADALADVTTDVVTTESECGVQSTAARAGMAQSSGYSGTAIDYGNLYDVPCSTTAECLGPCVAAGGTTQSCSQGNLCLSGQVGDSGLPNHCLPPCYWLDLTGAIGTGSQITPASDTQAFDNGYNDTLMLTQFGLAVPGDATILGIEFSVDRSASDSLASDASVFVLQNGAAAGTDHRTAGAWPTTYASAVYGGPADTWGVTAWTAAQVNSAGFGVAITPQYASTGAGTVYVDSVTATVYYRLPCP